MCHEQQCIDPSADDDADGVDNATEIASGTNPFSSGGGGGPGDLPLGAACTANGACRSGLCLEDHCLDPSRDDDSDGLANNEEAARGTSPTNPDSDGDCLRDDTDPAPTVKAEPDACAPTIWNIDFPSPGIDLNACRQGLSYSSQNIAVHYDGTFDDTWAPNEPNTLRVTGTLANGNLIATLDCLVNDSSGTLAATGGASLTGTWSFAGKSGSINVRQ